MQRHVITISCPDRPGIIAAVTSALAESGCNILDLTQHTASDIGLFMLKGLFELPPATEADPEQSGLLTLKGTLNQLSTTWSMDWDLHDTSTRIRTAILVSKTNHCLWELLLKHQDGELDCHIPLVLSNHTTNQHIASQFGIDFRHIDYNQGKPRAEQQILQYLDTHNIDLLVMARFMQILSPQFTSQWKNRIINIHHGFLPAFKGARPYHQAWYKGVKIIGATAHFANENLDQGPIITQEVIDVSDRSSIRHLVQTGKDIERRTLVDALKLYLNHSIFVHADRTFILD